MSWCHIKGLPIPVLRYISSREAASSWWWCPLVSVRMRIINAGTINRWIMLTLFPIPTRTHGLNFNSHMIQWCFILQLWLHGWLNFKTDHWRGNVLRCLSPSSPWSATGSLWFKSAFVPVAPLLGLLLYSLFGALRLFDFNLLVVAQLAKLAGSSRCLFTGSVMVSLSHSSSVRFNFWPEVEVVVVFVSIAVSSSLSSIIVVLNRATPLDI